MLKRNTASSDLQNRRGCFLVLDGIDGCGKSAQSKALAGWLNDQQINTLLTREPGGSPLAETLRSIVLDPKFHPTWECELLIMLAARLDHLEHTVKPALARGIWVVCDRFDDSTYAYQGRGDEERERNIATIQSALRKNTVEPDVTVILDADIETANERKGLRDQANDRIESEHGARNEELRSGFLRRTRNTKRTYIEIDAKGEMHEVQQSIREAIKPWIHEREKGQGSHARKRGHPHHTEGARGHQGERQSPESTMAPPIRGASRGSQNSP